MNMRSKPFTTAYAAILACVLIVLPAVAIAVTEREQRDCRAEYDRYCKAYTLGSEGLRACMSRSVRKLSSRCVDALVDAGEMTRSQADRLRHKPAHAKRSTHRSHKHSHKRH
jgi:hypothetical protein